MIDLSHSLEITYPIDYCIAVLNNSVTTIFRQVELTKLPGHDTTNGKVIDSDYQMLFYSFIIGDYPLRYHSKQLEQIL